MSSAPAPVALFTYNRPSHLERTLESLERNRGFSESPVFVFADGVRCPEDEAPVRRVRDLLELWRKPNVEIVASPVNRGIAASIRHGVRRLTESFGRVIVLEDDLVTGTYFLEFMNEALDRYEHEPRVLQISGFGYGRGIASAPDCFFTPIAASWGWATWRRAWDGFLACEGSAFETLRRSFSARRRFDQGSQYPLYYMLRRSAHRQLDSWAIWFQAYVFQESGLALWPAETLVKNIGIDGSGVHGKWTRKTAARIAGEPSRAPVHTFPTSVDIDPVQWRELRVVLDRARPWWYRTLARWTEIFP